MKTVRRVRFIKTIFWQEFNFEIKKPEGLCHITPEYIGEYDEKLDSYVFPEIHGTENNANWNEEKKCWQYPTKMIKPIIPAWFFKPDTTWCNEPLQFEFLK